MLLLASQTRHLIAEDTNADSKTVLDPIPFLSARAGGMAGAISTVADGGDAPFYNPAGIGHSATKKSSKSSVNLLYFPYIGVSANENAMDLQKDFNTNNASEDKVLGDAVLRAHEGERQYVRANALAGIGIGRFILLQYQDLQLAAVKKPRDEVPDAVPTAYRSLQGTGAGFSFSNDQDTLRFGVYGALNSFTEIQTEVPYESLSTSSGRSELTKEHGLRYEGTATNVGMSWVMANYGKPTIAIVNKDMGGSRYKLKNSASHPEVKTSKTDKEDYTLGFSLSPQLGKNHNLNFIVEGQHLNDSDLAINKKFRTALELNLWGQGSDAPISLRSGYNLAGLSYGLALNMGLVELEVASFAEDVGINNKHLKDTRLQAVFLVNVLDTD